jgi:hypothetical protein
VARVEIVQGLEVRFDRGPKHRARIRSGLGAGLTVVVRGLGHQVLETVGLLNMVELGDAEFDEHFSVRARNHDLARNVLTPEVRASLLTMAGLLDLECVEDEFRFTLPDGDIDAGAALQLVLRTIHLMRDAATSL